MKTTSTTPPSPLTGFPRDTARWRLRPGHWATPAGLLTLAATLLTQSLFAQGWYTVDDFQYSPGKLAFATGLAKDPTGTIVYSAGDGVDASGFYHALALQSSDGGTTWSLMDDYADPPGAPGDGPGYDAGIASDSSGNLYASGFNYLPGAQTWFTRRSPNGGVTWSTVDTVTAFGGAVHALATDAAGNVYEAGMIQPNNIPAVRIGTGGTAWATVDLPTTSTRSFTGGAWVSGVFCHPTAGVFVVGQQLAPRQNSKIEPTYAWTVWRSQNGGVTWSTADTFQLNWQDGSLANGGGSDAAGNIYVVGRAGGTGGWHWIVRKSANGGNTWATVDDFPPTSTALPSAQAFGSDAHGNLFVAGILSGSSITWLVRESLSGTGSWQTVDTYQYASGQTSQPNAVLGDRSGGIYVAGYGYDSGGVSHWLVRKH